MAYTVEPVISDGPNGEVVVDFAINPHRELHNGSVDPFNQDFVEVDGQTRHVMADTEISDSLTQHEEEYIETLMESNPYIAKAIEWGADNLSQDYLDLYNERVENGNLDQLHAAVDDLVERYKADSVDKLSNTDDESSPEEENETEELSPEETAEINEVVEGLMSSEPQGEEFAEDWQEVVQQAREQGDETYAGMAAATAAYHAGEVSAQEAIEFVMENFEMEDVIRVYKQMAG